MISKKILATIGIAFAIGIVYSPTSAKASPLVQPISNIITPQPINNTNISFNNITSDKSPQGLLKKIEVYKEKEGFVTYTDNTSGKSYVAIMMGEKATAGYQVSVSSIKNLEGKINILVKETTPDKNSSSAQVVTYPCTIIELNQGIHLFNITVKNTDNKTYSYYDIERSLPPIGVSWTLGNVKNIYKENDFIFLELQNANGECQLFYSNNDANFQNRIKDLKLNTNVSIKYALGTPKQYNGKSAFPLSEVMLSVDKTSLTSKDWRSLKSHTDVAVDKQWLLSFNKELNIDFVNNTNIYVVDSNGTKIPTECSLTESKKSIRINPLKPYNAGETYYLFITSDVNPNTKHASKGFRMEFQIADEISVE